MSGRKQTRGPRTRVEVHLTPRTAQKLDFLCDVFSLDRSATIAYIVSRRFEYYSKREAANKVDRALLDVLN